MTSTGALGSVDDEAARARERDCPVLPCVPFTTVNADLVAADALDHIAAGALGDDVEVLAERQHDRILVRGPRLQQRDVLVEAARVLVRGLDGAQAPRMDRHRWY